MLRDLWLITDIVQVMKILNEYSDKFNLNVKCTTINDFGGWDNAYKQYFDDGALFDKLCN